MSDFYGVAPWKAWAASDESVMVALPSPTTPIRFSKRQAEALRTMLDRALDDCESFPDAVNVHGEPAVRRSW